MFLERLFQQDYVLIQTEQTESPLKTKVWKSAGILLQAYTMGIPAIQGEACGYQKGTDRNVDKVSSKKRPEPDRAKNDGMLVVTPRASQLMRELFKERKKRALRIFVKLGGCGIRSFGVAPERPGESDHVFEIDGFRYIVDKGLLERVRPIKVDSDGFGFRISGSGISPHHGCGNCGFMCGDGNRCSGDCATCSFHCSHGRRLRNAG
jgi:iron-sulfur cluster assembly protein